MDAPAELSEHLTGFSITFHQLVEVHDAVVERNEWHGGKLGVEVGVAFCDYRCFS
jgi:hypothetical protein